MKAVLIALFALIVAVMANRPATVGSCYDDVKNEYKCLQSKDSVSSCQWCVAHAVPSFCANTAQISTLPPSGFDCTNVTVPAPTGFEGIPSYLHF